jgi:hypothetical protein
MMLCAADFSLRIAHMPFGYLMLQADEVSQLVASQPSAVTAVRLQALLPLKKDSYSANDPLNKLSVSISLPISCH